jgi:hypothetical protein
MYQEKLKKFENIENLAGKAWQHAIAIDVLSQTAIKDCAIHCFHYQQMLELLFKHLLEIKHNILWHCKSLLFVQKNIVIIF